MPHPTRSAQSVRGETGLRRVRVTAVVLLGASCIVIAFITFWPAPPDPDGQRALRVILREAHLRGLPAWITFGRIEFSANVLMFVPIGLFGALSLPRAGWLIVPASIAGSAAIEVIQARHLTLRDGTPRDVIANGLGALVGYLLAALLLRYLRRRVRMPVVNAPAVAVNSVPTDG